MFNAGFEKIAVSNQYILKKIKGGLITRFPGRKWERNRDAKFRELGKLPHAIKYSPTSTDRVKNIAKALNKTTKTQSTVHKFKTRKFGPKPEEHSLLPTVATQPVKSNMAKKVGIGLLISSVIGAGGYAAWKKHKEKKNV